MSNKSTSRKGDYQKFVSSSGHELVCCGRNKQVLLLLIDGRKTGTALQRVAPNRPGNMAASIQGLKDGGVKLGRVGYTYADDQTLNGRGEGCRYLLLEDWVPVGGIRNYREEAEAEGVKDARPAIVDAYTPFLESGSITSRDDVVLLKSKQKGGKS